MAEQNYCLFLNLCFGFILRACADGNNVTAQVVLFILYFWFRIFGNSLGATLLPAEDRRLFLKFSSGLSRHTVSLLERHQCRVRLTPKTQTDSVEQWTAVMLECSNLQVNVISTILCHGDCVDPINCTKLRNLKGVPVNWDYNLVDRYGNASEIEMPVACKCVPRYAADKCRSYE